MAVTEEDPTSCCSSSGFMMDEIYEFSAPRFFDFLLGETDEDMRQAELWFDSALSYAPSPFMPRIKAGRSVQLESLCDFCDSEPIQKAVGSSCTATSVVAKETNLESEAKQTRRAETEIMLAESRGDSSPNVATILQVSADEKSYKGEGMFHAENGSMLTGSAASSTAKVKPHNNEDDATKSDVQATDACTPAPSKISQTANQLKTDYEKQQAAKKIASMVKNPLALKSKNQLQHLSQSKSILKPTSIRRDTNLKNTVGTPNFAQENQAIKRQKLEGGKSRQILNIKSQTLPHKLRPALCGSSNICSSTSRTSKEDRKMYVRETAAPFVSMAEMMKKFQSNTREMSVPRAISSSFPHDAAASIMQRKPKLTLTRPMEPKFETAQRVRSVKVKSSAELEEEMMAKMPKFKARPLNKKILETPTLPAIPKSTPQLPEFQEFHLETMARANQSAETATVTSIESSCQSQQWRPHLITAPKSPLLQTSLRARPPKIKSSVEMEKEQLENFPKFKARPLNKKILESKGDMGVFCNTKRQITVPQEFHFETDERIPQPVADLFDKLSLNSDSHHDKEFPRNTIPAPFHLHTEERGVEKEKRFFTELFHKQLEEERARIPKASPYPYTTDYPVVPPKPEPKQCTKPEPFQLESLVRHEEEMQREMEERQRIEMEEAQMKVFKAKPILEEDPIPVPEKVRKPLTQVQEFNLGVEHRAVDRAEFDKKIKEKEMMYKRYREEAESETKMEEEKALKQLRRTLVPHARPVPKFANPFLPKKSSKEVTKPKSPKLNVLRRKEKRSFWGVASSAASSMR